MKKILILGLVACYLLFLSVSIASAGYYPQYVSNETYEAGVFRCGDFAEHFVNEAREDGWDVYYLYAINKIGQDHILVILNNETICEVVESQSGYSIHIDDLKIQYFGVYWGYNLRHIKGGMAFVDNRIGTVYF